MILLKSSPGKAKGLDDDSGLKMALDDAVKFAATYRKGKEIPRDLSDIKQEKRIKKLKNDLKLSKQQVVRHLIQCRAIETTMKQSILTNEAIKNHISINPIKMESKNQNSTRSNLVRSFNNNGGLSSAYLGEIVYHFCVGSDGLFQCLFYLSYLLYPDLFFFMFLQLNVTSRRLKGFLPLSILKTSVHSPTSRPSVYKEV